MAKIRQIKTARLGQQGSIHAIRFGSRGFAQLAGPLRVHRRDGKTRIKQKRDEGE